MPGWRHEKNKCATKIEFSERLLRVRLACTVCTAVLVLGGRGPSHFCVKQARVKLSVQHNIVVRLSVQHNIQKRTQLVLR